MHADGTVRAAAAEVMLRCMRGLPPLRNAVLLGVAAFSMRLADDQPEVTCSSSGICVCLSTYFALLCTRLRLTVHQGNRKVSD